MYELRLEAALSSAKCCLSACDLAKLISQVERSCDQTLSEVNSANSHSPLSNLQSHLSVNVENGTTSAPSINEPMYLMGH
jgi:hypothetical protein